MGAMSGRGGEDGARSHLAGDRERILAALGWEKDPRRGKVLHDLLREHLQPVYLFAYDQERSKARALDRARVTLLKAARTLDRVPEGCTLSAWLLLFLAGETAQQAECPEPCRFLAGSRDPGQPPERADAAHLEAHRGCRNLRQGYERFLALPEDGELRARSGLEAAVSDLDHYLRGQFGEAAVPTSPRGFHWRQFVPTSRWLRSRAVATVVSLAVIALAVLLARAWFAGSEHPFAIRKPESTTAALPPVPTGPTPEKIENASVQIEGSDLVFGWSSFPPATNYRLLILTAKLDTLRDVPSISETTTRIPAASIRGLASGGSYLFRVDGLRNGRRIASTGFTPFELP